MENYSKIKSLFKEILKVGHKEFDSYNEALEYCNQKTKGGYQSKLLSKYRFEKCSNFLKDDFHWQKSTSILSLLFSITFLLSKKKVSCPAIIDFGGACGESLLVLKKIFGDEVLKKSWIVESQKIVEESRNWEFASKIQFSQDILEVLKNNKIDIFFTSGTINYLPEPMEILKTIAKSEIPIISLTRNNFSPYKKIVAQKSFLSDNGSGSHILSYGNPKIFYPNTSTNKNEITHLFQKNGYKLIYDSPERDGIVQKNHTGGDLLFFKSN